MFQRKLNLSDRPGFRYHLKVHSFRTLTVIASWLLIALAFYQKPEYLTSMQRAIQRGIEWTGDAIPPPWGPRIVVIGARPLTISFCQLFLQIPDENALRLRV